jgi:DNA polymerase type B, organellar and viral
MVYEKKKFFPEQLKAALKYGYKIELINGHEFSSFNLFNEYIYHFYNIILEKKKNL